MLPTLGLARLGSAEPFGFAEVECANGRATLWTPETKIIIPDERSSSWWPLRSIDVEARSLRLKVWLDDIDPFRGLTDPLPPDRLGDREFENWRQLVTEAWEILCADDPSGAAAIAEGMRTLVPMPAAPGWGTQSASSGDAFGSAMVSLPPEATTMAVSVVHEFQHVKLGGLMHLMALSNGDPPGHYAPWRDDPRPLVGLFQGVYAFLGIAAFWRTRRLALSGAERKTADFAYLCARRQTERAVAELSRSEILTRPGRMVAQGMVDRIRDWQADQVPGAVAELADLVTDAHRAGWRIRHSRPTDETVDALVRSWLTGTPEAVVPAEADVELGEDAGWSHARLGLARRMVRAVEPVSSVKDLAAYDWARTVVQADIDLFRGNRAAARAGFVQAIIADPANPDAWTGLGLTLASDHRLAGAVLLEHLGLIRSAYLEVIEQATDRPAPDQFAEEMVARLAFPA